MRIENHTDTPTKLIEKMVDFVQKYIPRSTVAKIVVCDQSYEHQRVTGQATTPNKHDGSPYPALVEIWIPPLPTREYPVEEQYVPELPPMRLMNKDEELFLVLAHELRHIFQQWTQGYERFDGYELEVDAESFAYKALKLWRVGGRIRPCVRQAA